MQHCTDETADKEMNNSASPMAKQICSKQEIQKTSTGYVIDSVCDVGGVDLTSHAEITGDFNSGLHREATSHSGGRSGRRCGARHVRDARSQMAGACEADQKPGDIVVPGGFKMNVAGTSASGPALLRSTSSWGGPAGQE